MIIKSNSVGGILANYGRGTWAAWTHLSFDGMAYKRIIILFNIRYRYKNQDRDIKIGKDIHRHDNTERDIGGSHTCHGLLYSIVFYWSKFQTNIYSPVLEYTIVSVRLFQID